MPRVTSMELAVAIPCWDPERIAAYTRSAELFPHGNPFQSTSAVAQVARDLRGDGQRPNGLPRRTPGRQVILCCSVP